MTKLSDLQNRIDNVIRRLDAELEVQAAKAGQDIVALITNRVVQRGETAEGDKFTPYSTTEVPAFFFLGRGRTTGSDNAIKQKAQKKEKVSYKDFRALNNLNTTPKNFEFTGEMWRGFGVIEVQKTASGALVVIGGRNTDSENRIKWNSEQEKQSIIKPSKKELEIVTANLSRWLNNLINGRENRT